jgi:hypothetical protein
MRKHHNIPYWLIVLYAIGAGIYLAFVVGIIALMLLGIRWLWLNT